MKKVLATTMAVVATCATLGFSACGATQDEVKVFKDILLTEEEYAFAIAKENDTLETQVNAILADMMNDGSLETLINSYFDGNSDFTYTNKTASPQEGDFVVATNAYFPPFEYYVGDSFSGVDIELASIIATSLNKTLFVKDMDFDAIIPDVLNECR